MRKRRAYEASFTDIARLLGVTIVQSKYLTLTLSLFNHYYSSSGDFGCLGGRNHMLTASLERDCSSAPRA